MDRLTALKVFTTIVERGSMTAAADQLDMSRAMVTRYLNEMESWMGVRLLHRTTRRLSLTSQGEEALDYARQMLQMGEALEQVAEQSSDTLQGQLRITASYSMIETFLLQVSHAFQEQNPLAKIDILSLDQSVNLIEERIDLAIRITNDLDPNLIARPLGTCHSIVCAAPSYLEREGTPQDVQSLADHNCLTFTYFGKSLWEFTRDGQPESVAVSGNLSSNMSNVLLKAALLGQGVVQQPLPSVQPYLESGELVPLVSDWQAKAMGVYAIYASRKQVTPLHRAYLDFLIAKMQADPLWR